MDRYATERSVERGRCPAPSALRCLFLDTTRLVGEHRYGRRIASSDTSDLGHERWRSSSAIRRTVTHARNSPTRLQEREVHLAHYLGRFYEGIRQGPWLRLAGRWIRLVRGHLNIFSPAPRLSPQRSKGALALLRFDSPVPVL